MATATVARARIVGASVAGPSHAARGTGCQDAFATETLDDDTTVVAVADGLGSARHAQVGAHAGVATAVRAARALLSAGPDLPLADAAEQVLRCARLGVLAAAGDDPAHDLACTMLIVLQRDDRVAVAQIGDGGVAVRGPEGWQMLSTGARQEYVDVTDALTAADWHARRRISGPASDVTAFAAFTDGCARAAIAPDGTAFAGFLDPIVEHVRNGGDAAALEALLAGPKMSEHSDDDKTIVLAVGGG